MALTKLTLLLWLSSLVIIQFSQCLPESVSKQTGRHQVNKMTNDEENPQDLDDDDLELHLNVLDPDKTTGDQTQMIRLEPSDFALSDDIYDPDSEYGDEGGELTRVGANQMSRGKAVVSNANKHNINGLVGRRR